MNTRMPLDAGASRPEAMADVPGVNELDLTRAVVQYRDIHEVEFEGGRIDDIGMALVLEARHPSDADVVDLGSAQVKRLDLTTELVVLDWVYRPTMVHVSEMLAARARGRERDTVERLRPYCFDLARRVLARIGFGPFSRSTLLRIGFRDVCRDLDLHEGTSVRLVLPGGGLVRAHLDYDACALVLRTASGRPDPGFEDALAEAFPTREVRRVERVRGRGPLSYQVRFPLPLALSELRATLAEMRRGVDGLLARFEPGRHQAAHEVLDALGSRETLAGVRIAEPPVRTVRLDRRAAPADPSRPAARAGEDADSDAATRRAADPEDAPATRMPGRSPGRAPGPDPDRGDSRGGPSGRPTVH